MQNWANLIKDRNLTAMLKELRLLGGQPRYRYCMAWLIVVSHVAIRGILVWVIAQQVISKL